MKREIKFNAWDENSGLLLESVTVGYGSIGIPKDEEIDALLKSKGFNPDEDELPDNWWDTGEDWYVIEDKFTILQYIGLKDKQEKEIFDGHIVKCDGATTPAEVVWINEIGAWGLDAHRGNDTQNNPFESYCFDEATVIGYIYENHELLEGGNQ